MSLLKFNPKNERIARAEQRLSAAYRREPGHIVPIVGPTPSFQTYSEKECIEDLDKMLAASAAHANAMAGADNDSVPLINTYCTVPMVPQAFGCRVEYTPDGIGWTKPVITDINQVWSLKPMKLSEAQLIHRLSQWIDYAQRLLGVEVPFWTSDLQSPFSVAVEIVDANELLTACITEPKAVHHLCQMVADFSIEWMRQHLSQMEHPGFPGRNFPSISDNIGICIADDTPLIMLSPEMYREFALPYNSQIGEAFGGVHVHSCGNYLHNLDNLLQIKNIRSIQAHAGPGEISLPAAATEPCPFNRARRRIAYKIDTNSVSWAGQFPDSATIYRDYIIPRLSQGDLTGCILDSASGPEIKTPADANYWTQWTREQLAMAGCEKQKISGLPGRGAR